MRSKIHCVFPYFLSNNNTAGTELWINFSKCQDNMSFHVQKWPDNSNGWLDIPSKKEAKKKE